MQPSLRLYEGRQPVKKVKFVIVGGGISGLSTAFFLKEKLRLLGRDDSILLLEEKSRVGGHILSLKREGFIFDGGPRGFLAKGRRTLDLCHSLGLWDQIQLSDDSAKYRYIWKNDYLHPLPTGILELFSSKIIGWKEIRSIIGEYFKTSKPGISDESVAEFIIRRFSEDMLHNFFELLITGVYAGNPKRLSALAVFPKLKELEAKHGSIIKGLMKTKKDKLQDDYPDKVMSINKRKLVSFKEGMGTLVDALEANLGPIIQTSAKIVDIQYQENGLPIIRYQQKGQDLLIDAENLILAAPAYNSSELTRNLLPEISPLLAEIEYAPMQEVVLGYHHQVHFYNGFGFLSPRNEKLTMLGCVWNDMIFPFSAPTNSMNLTAIYGGACHPETRDWSEEQLLSESKRELKKTMNIHEDPDVFHTFTYENGIPQYNIGHSKRIENIFAILENHPHVFLTGSYIKGVGINDCVKNAFQLVDNLDLNTHI